MTDEERLEKNKRIADCNRNTRLKRQHQICKVYDVKIDYSTLSNKQKEQLKMLFVEAKWFYNDILNWSETGHITEYDTSTKTVEVKNKDNIFITRKLNYLGSQMKQTILTDIKSAIKGLSVLKSHGHKVGKLKFKSDCKCIPLNQFKKTHNIINEKYITVSRVNSKIRVRGLDQFIFKPNIEIANAKLLQRPNGYYIAFTTFQNETDIEQKPYIDKEIGIDMGIKNSITLSNGEKFNSTIEETERLKRLQRQLFRRIKGSNNRKKTIKLIEKEYQHISNIKNDTANKLVHYILQFETVYMQDEMISNWHKGLFGKQIQHSILRRVKSKLINNSRVEVLDRKVPTTQYCPICGQLTKHTLDKRTYHCDHCGYEDDRDINAAKNMIRMVKLIKIKNSVPTEHRDFKPLEILSSTDSNTFSKSESLN